MQLMPATARSLGVDPADPEQSIQGGIRYDRHLWDFWSIISSAGERRRFMFASYNAGPGSIRKAARLSNDKQRWATVSAALPCVTGAHAKETIRYINHIEEVFSRGAR
jgi:soluble lytic murein transglycosylase-like protein